MDPEQHARVEAIVRLACDCAPSERDALVAAECGDDDSLRRAVERGIERETSAPTARALRPDSLALAPGTLVGGRYRVESELGAGGMGRVYRATQIALRREVALKVLSAGPDASPSALERFEREAAAVARLRHPNIVEVYDAGAEPGVGAFFAMELVRGRSLADELQHRGQLSVAEAVDVVRQVADAVDAAHATGLIHRDLKPANVMLEGGTAKVLDFGVAKLADESSADRAARLTASGAAVGTPLYMSPEQARGLAVDRRTDVWSLGVLLYELVAGASPFVRPSAPETFAAILRDEPAPLDTSVANVPPALARLVDRALAKDPAARPATARDVAAELERIARALASGAPDRDAVPARPTNLTSSFEPLIGRHAALAELVDELGREGVRLVTLTGPGGAGKTRLARAAALALLPDFEDGVFFVDLSALDDPGLVIPTIARELGVREEGAAPMADLLAERLRDANVLLVLDNLEQVVESAPAIADLLKRSKRARVLATSRAPLRVGAERVRVVPPLDVPSAGAALPLDQLGRCAAVALFVERARNVKRGFALTEQNAADVAAICRELDGLPLALELAAARLKLLSPAALLARLGERLRLLTQGDRDLSERQRTMRGAIAWSYDLLDEETKRVFERLAVFAGGCRLEQADAVVRGTGGAHADVADALDTLVEGSLVAAADEPDGEVRFRMLGVVREFALARLGERSESEATARAHAEVFRDFAVDAVGYLTGEDMAEWLERLEREHDNFRAALAWSLDHDPETCLGLAGAVGNLWTVHEHYAEGRRWLDAALAAGAGVSPAVRAKALRKAGTLARHQGDLTAARAYYEESLAVSNATGDPVQIAWANIAMGHLMQDLGDLAAARAYLERCIELSRETGQQRQAANALNDLGELAFLESDLPAARGYYERSAELFRRIGDLDGISATVGNLGKLAVLAGDHETAAPLLREALAIDVSLGSKHGIVSHLDALAAVALARGDRERAARLAAAVDAHAAAMGFSWDLPQRVFRETYSARLEAELGTGALASSAEHGRALTLDEAIALALQGD